MFLDIEFFYSNVYYLQIILLYIYKIFMIYYHTDKWSIKTRKQEKIYNTINNRNFCLHFLFLLKIAEFSEDTLCHKCVNFLWEDSNVKLIRFPIIKWEILYTFVLYRYSDRLSLQS